MRPSEKGKDTCPSCHKSCVQINRHASWALVLGRPSRPGAFCKVSGPSLLSGPGQRTLQGVPGSCPNKPRTLGVHVEKAAAPAPCPRLPPGKERRGRLLSTAIYRHASRTGDAPPPPGLGQGEVWQQTYRSPGRRKRGERGLASVINLPVQPWANHAPVWTMWHTELRCQDSQGLGV